LSTDVRHPFTPLDGLEEVAPGVAFVSSFANVVAIDTDGGLVLVDTGSAFSADRIHAAVRGWSSRRVDTAVYTHGPGDHVLGLPPFEAEATGKGWARPRVVAHEAVPARFDRYRLTAGLNGTINARQFRVPGLTWPTEYRYPDVTYRSEHVLDVG